MSFIQASETPPSVTPSVELRSLPATCVSGTCRVDGSHRRDATFEDAEANGDKRLHEQVQDAVEHCGARRGPQARLQDHARIVACGNEGRVDAGATISALLVAVVRKGIWTFPVTVFERASGGLCGNKSRRSAQFSGAT